MPERPDPRNRPEGGEQPEYGWLYGEPQDDSDATQRIRTSADPYAAADAGEPDRTRVMPTRPRPRPYEQPPRAPARPPRAAAAPPRRRRHWGRIVLVVILLWVLLLVAVPIWAWSKIEKVDAEPSVDRPADTPGATYLLVGSDSREGLSKEEKQEFATGSASGQRTDTIMVMHVPRFGGKTLLLSLPRDSLVNVPGYGEEKINAAFAYGGPRLLVRTVEQATGLRMDNYVEIGFGGFVGMVDAVGGVEICPRAAMKDPKANLDIKKGCQEADGPTALGYVRSRQTDALGDIARVARQREVVGAVAGNAASPWTLINPYRYIRTAGAGADALRIGENVGPIDLARFAWGMRKVTGEDGLTCTVPYVDLSVRWDEPKAEELFGHIADDNTDEIDCFQPEKQ
ncbi:MAG: LytR family transcriptional regulator [Propionibacteriales bacterium]|nr:LytR family transcriptional regulator [Propionibacteriales bacterium]